MSYARATPIEMVEGSKEKRTIRVSICAPKLTKTSVQMGSSEETPKGLGMSKIYCAFLG